MTKLVFCSENHFFFYNHASSVWSKIANAWRHVSSLTITKLIICLFFHWYFCMRSPQLYSVWQGCEDLWLCWPHERLSCRLPGAPEVALNVHSTRINNVNGIKTKQITCSCLFGLSWMFHLPLHRRYRHFNHRKTFADQHQTSGTARIRMISETLLFPVFYASRNRSSRDFLCILDAVRAPPTR